MPPATGTNEENMWAMFCHLAAFAGLFIPFGNILGPLVVWLLKREEYALVEDQGKESLNFQISITIYGIIAGVLVLVIIGFFLLLALGLFALIMTIMAALKANSGEPYRYPMTIRLIS